MYSILKNIKDLNTIAIFYPKEFRNHPILQENMKNLNSNLNTWINAKETYEREKRFMDSLHFDSEINKQREIIKNTEIDLKKADEKLNKEISPYKWRVIERFVKCIEGQDIRADYALFLEDKR